MTDTERVVTNVERQVEDRERRREIGVSLDGARVLEPPLRHGESARQIVVCQVEADHVQVLRVVVDPAERANMCIANEWRSVLR